VEDSGEMCSRRGEFWRACFFLNEYEDEFPSGLRTETSEIGTLECTILSGCVGDSIL
jgi:hypothetical protein